MKSSIIGGKIEFLPLQLSVDKMLWENGGNATAIFVRFNKKERRCLL